MLAQASSTQPVNPVYDGTAYYYIPWSHNKPCVVVESFWENCSYRITALCLLNNIVDKLVSIISLNSSLLLSIHPFTRIFSSIHPFIHSPVIFSLIHTLAYFFILHLSYFHSVHLSYFHPFISHTCIFIHSFIHLSYMYFHPFIHSLVIFLTQESSIRNIRRLLRLPAKYQELVPDNLSTLCDELLEDLM